MERGTGRVAGSHPGGGIVSGPGAEHRTLRLPSGVDLHAVVWPAAAGPRDGSAGVPWLLVHGLASNAHLWDGVADHLVTLGHEVAAIDQRGHGSSSKVDGPFDMATVADDLALVLDALGWDSAAVAGQSWGGNVVLELGARHPTRTRLVVCVDGGFIDLQERFPAWEDCEQALAPPRTAGMRADALAEALRGWHPDWPEAAIAGTLANFEQRPDGTVAPWLTYERHLAVLRGLWEHRPSTRYPTMQVPVLLVPADTGDAPWTISKHDAVSAALEALPRGAAHWFRADHDVHAQHPVEVATLLHAALTDPGLFPEGTAG
jgi:pimeloyl-ACP methyl ester carboxylesterase